MIRYLVIGALLFAGFGIAVAPAGLLKRALAANSPIELLEARGTVWHGDANLLYTQIPLGHISWNFNEIGVLRLNLGYAWELNDQHWQVNGEISRSVSRVQGQLQGTVYSEGVRQWLAIYDISLSGHVTFAPTAFALDPANGQFNELTGQAQYSGGNVRYVLSGQIYDAVLPPLDIFFGTNSTGEPQAVVQATGAQTPLMFVTLRSNGFVKVGVTKQFTKLLNNVWPGSDPDHATVIEVEEQVF